jgi:protein-S-isoprenylcysteine O-methyltransferase Ste14
MTAVYRNLFYFMWGGWIAYWWLSSLRVKRIVREESVGSRLTHMLPLMIAAILLASPGLRLGLLDGQVLTPSVATFWTGAAITAAGLLFSVWARVHLGANWSGTVTIKESHELVTTGPYAIVRHPIYTGLLLGLIGSAIALERWRGVLAVVIALVGILHKLRIEERWMTEQFGDTYRAYAARVPRLIPFARIGSRER